MRWVWVLALVACGGRHEGDLCARLASWDPAVHDGTCARNRVPNEITDTGCLEAMPACSDADFDQLTAFADCLEALPVCVPGTETSYNAQLMACTVMQADVRAACMNAF